MFKLSFDSKFGISLSRNVSYQHVHKNDGHSQHKQKEQDICQCSVFQFAPRHKRVGVVEFTEGHHKYGHHGIRKRRVGLLQIKKIG